MSALKQLRQRAAELLAARRLNEAQAAYGELLARAPKDFEALHRLGMLKVQNGAPEEGRKLLADAIAIDPAHAEARLHYGLALQNLGRGEEAAAEYAQAIALTPDYPEALFQLGLLSRQLGRLGEALSCFERCVPLAPREPHVFLQRGELHFLLKDFAAALGDFDRALELQRDAAAAGGPTPMLNRADILFNRAAALEGLARETEALATYEQVIALAPGNPKAWNRRADLLLIANRPEEAEPSYRRALALNPAHAAARAGHGFVLTLLGRNREAIGEFRRLAESDPANPQILGGLLGAAQPICDWDTLDAVRPELEKAARSGNTKVGPFHLLVSFSDPKFLLDTTRFRSATLPPTGPRPPLRPADGKIRLAYLSSDFHAHATAWLIADLFERHDRARFEVIAVSFDTEAGGPVRMRLKQGCDRFIEVQAMPDAEVAALLRQMKVDIAIDLKGYVKGERAGIFSHRAAPVQVSYLGYPGTMAVDFHDYVLGDSVVLPHDQQPFWSENIVHLPDCYQVNDPSRPHEAPLSRAEAGLPASGFVFGCFNNHFKIDRPMFESWMRLLAAVPGSVLWLLDNSANDQLREHARARGIDPGRLIFAPRCDVGSHLRRQPCADLMLDTLPYGAHTTASDALWMGVPMVTCLGTTFAGRVASSLLTAIHCPELITHSLTEYEALALELARDSAKLTTLRRKLAANRLTTPLFDAPRFCRHIEQAYVTMMEIARAGETPRPFDIPVLAP